MNNRQRKGLELAVRLARKFDHDSPCHLASVLMSGSNIVSAGQNYTRKTHTKSPHPFKTIHAEVDCLMGNTMPEMAGSTLFVARVGYNNRCRILLAKPCIWCQSYIVRAGVRFVYYTIDEQATGFWDVKNNEWGNA